MRKKRMIVSVEYAATRIFTLLALVMFAILFYYSFGMTWKNSAVMNEEMVYFHPDSLLGNALCTGCGILIIYIVCRIYDGLSDWLDTTKLAYLVCLCAALFGIYWIKAVNTSPIADQEIVCNLASAFNQGDVSSFEKGEYAGRNRHQLGLITIMRVVFFMFGDGNYRAFQYFSALLLPLIIFSGFKIVKRITRDSRYAEISYLLLILFCVPMYGYVPFVYGEVCSTAFVMLAAWMLTDCLNEFSWMKAVILAAAMGVAVQMRQNTLILCISFLIVVVMKVMDQRKWKTALVGICMLTGVVGGQITVNAIYSPYIPEDSKATPSILYIVMGTGFDDNDAGWYNEYNDEIYKAYDYDPEAAAGQGYEDLRAFLWECREDPEYARFFYFKKLNTQWNAPMYQFISMNSNFAGEKSTFAEAVYYGGLRELLEKYMNIYQLLVYGGVLILMVIKRKAWVKIENHALLIGIFGGFLFSLMWEAKTRYVFPYFIMMLPYAAGGIAEILQRLYALDRFNWKHMDVDQKQEVHRMFWKKKAAERKEYDRENEIPVIRSSICTGEQIAGFKNKNTGAFRDIMCIRSEADRQKFLTEYGIKAEEVRKEW